MHIHRSYTTKTRNNDCAEKTIENYVGGNIKRNWLFSVGNYLHSDLFFPSSPFVIKDAGFELYTNINFPLIQRSQKRRNPISYECIKNAGAIVFRFYIGSCTNIYPFLNHIIDLTLCVLNTNSLNTGYTMLWQEHNRKYYLYSMHILIER